MGNLAGGYMAKQMGLPLGKLCAVVNVNDITHRAFQNGEFYKSPHMIKTLSEAINIQVVRWKFEQSEQVAAVRVRVLTGRYRNAALQL
jgi:threonine synthase